MSITVRGMVPLIQVFDMPESLRFYCDKLGFTLVDGAGPEGDMGWAMLRLCVPEGHAAAAGNASATNKEMLHAHCIELMLNTQYELHERPPQRDPARTAAHADTALYFGCPDVPAAFAHMRAAGLDVKPPYVTGYGFDAVDVTDPDGYVISFHWPAKKPG